MKQPGEHFSVHAIRVVEFIGHLDDNFPQSLIVKYSDKADSPLQSVNGKLDNRIRGTQHLKLAQSGCTLIQGSVLSIEIYKKHSRRQKVPRLGITPRGDPMCKASVNFDDLWQHLASETWIEAKSNFKVEFDNRVQGLQLWVVIEAYSIDMNTVDERIKHAMEELNKFRPALSRLGPAGNVTGTFIDLGKAISGLNPVAQAVVACIEFVYQRFEGQEESHGVMQRLTESMMVLAGQLNRFKGIPISDELSDTMREFPVLTEEVVNFIQRWLESCMFKHIFDDSQKERTIKLREKLDAFKDRFDRNLIIEIQVKAAGEKKLDDLVHAVAKPLLRNPCMEGTRSDILDKIESELKSADGPNVIWIRGSPGVGKSALVASIATRLQEQNRKVIWFRFDRRESATINTDALWRVVAHDLAHLYPSVCRHILEDNKKPISSDIDRIFEWLIDRPLSTLNGVSREELPVIVIDALDECGGLRHDSSGKRDYEALLRTLKHWVEVDHLKKFKLIITSRPEDRITETFPDSISTHINIPSGNDVKPGDSASDDIRVFLKSRLNNMKVGDEWVKKALDYLVPCATGIFIWATTVADFLEFGPEVRFDILEARKRGTDTEGLDDLYSLYSTVVETSFGNITKQEIEGIVSIMGAMIFSRQSLDDNTLVMLPGVKIRSSNLMRSIRKGLASVIESGSMLRFHHRSFEDFLLSDSFRQKLPKLSTVQNRNLHERQLAVLCLNTMVSSELHFNMCRLKSSSIRNIDVPPDAISLQVSYSCQFWADHFVHTPSEDQFMEAVKFVIHEKLLFWMEVMSVLGKAHEIFGILTKALAWPGLKTFDPDNELTSFIRDALRFISAFIVPISESAPHIYLSALPFSPEHSLVANNFCSRFPNTLKVVEGKPVQWPMTIFTAEHHNDSVKSIVFSPDGKTFASISTRFMNDIAIMYICDSETGYCISGPFEPEDKLFLHWYSFLASSSDIIDDMAMFAESDAVAVDALELSLPKSLSYCYPNVDALADTYSYPNNVDADICFSPDGKHVLAQYVHGAEVWDIERGKKQFEIKGYDSVYIHYGRYRGRIASIHQDWTGVRVKLWDAGNGVLMYDRLFEMTGVGATLLSPDGRLLAIGKRSGNVIELWNVEDGKDVQLFPYPSGNLSSLRFSPTSDSLVGAFRSPDRIRLWRLDTQEMASINVLVGPIPPAVIHLPSTDRLFISQDHTVEIWEVSMTGSNMIYKIESPMTSKITCICPSRDGRRLLVGGEDGRVMMWSLSAENLAEDRLVAANTQDDTRVISLSRSGKIVATKLQSDHVEFRDTTTWEVVGRTDIEYECDMKIVFSPDDNQIAFWHDSVITIYDVMCPEKIRLSFKPWPRGRHCFIKIAFQTCDDLVICAELDDSDLLLQVWHLTDLECASSFDTKIPKYSRIFLAPDGLTVVIANRDTASCYSWNHDTAQFDPFHFTDEAHLVGYRHVYSPDGELLACWSYRDCNIRVWDTRTGQLCGKSTTVVDVNGIGLSPALNDQSFGDRIIALGSSNTISVYDVHTGHLHARFYAPENVNSYPSMTFIQDGTKLALHSFEAETMRIWDLRAEYSHATHKYELFPQKMKDGWMMDQDNAPLFWVPLEHREFLWASLARVIIGVPREKTMSLDLSSSRLGNEWTECIDIGWLKALREKEVTRKLLE